MPVGLALAAMVLGLVRPGRPHPRAAAAPPPRAWQGWWPGVALAAGSAAVGRMGWTLLDSPGGGPLALRLPVYVGAAGLFLGGALLAVRVGAAVAARLERRLPGADAGLALALREVRGGAIGLVALPALAVAATVFAMSGGPAVAGVGADYRSVNTGASARVQETVPRPCGSCQGPEATIRDWPHRPPQALFVPPLPGMEIHFRPEDHGPSAALAVRLSGHALCRGRTASPHPCAPGASGRGGIRS